MKILVLCSYGQNRSRVLAKHLQNKGYDADFAGVECDHTDVQEKIDSSDVVVTVHPEVKNKLLADFDIKGKRLVELEVDDRAQCVLPSKKPLSGDEWIKFQQENVWNKIIEQADKYF